MQEAKINSTYVREWVSDESKANLIIIHGAGEHSGRYIKTAEYFVENGYNVYTGDLVGHGLSDGTRMFINSIKDYIKDVEFFLNRIDNKKPTYLLGHSMGGLIVLYYMLSGGSREINGVIASSPYIKDKIDIPKVKYLIGKVAASICPKLKIDSGLKGEMVCRDKDIAEFYNRDTLNCSKVTAKWFVELEKARNLLVEMQKEFTVPCLILQAGGDIVVDSEVVRQFYQGISSKDKEFISYDDFYHEILNDPEREQVLDKINSWMDTRL
ncbi:MAG: lysophospholipase [Lutisporaceae bacterium]